MQKSDINFPKIPSNPGVYFFVDKQGKKLYIGRATSLRNRVRSYFSKNLLNTRGVIICEAVTKAHKVEYKATKSLLDAIILEAYLIKKHKPVFNTKEKDNKSFLFVIITNEKFPRVLSVRGRDIGNKFNEKDIQYKFGPFTCSGVLKQVLKVVRTSFPFRDKCKIYDKRANISTRGCLNSQIGLCPGVCSGKMLLKDYQKRTREIVMFFEGKKDKLIDILEKQMNKFAKSEEFEKAEEVKKRLKALYYTNDILFINKEIVEGDGAHFRVEGFDVSHTAGLDGVGVMTVVEDGVAKKSKYRSFNIKHAKVGDDVGCIEEILNRRLKHFEWGYPNLIVVDGGRAQLNRAKKVMDEHGYLIPILSTVKNDKHKVVDILGGKNSFREKEREILLANSEAHRFSLARHIRRRSKGTYAR